MAGPDVVQVALPKQTTLINFRKYQEKPPFMSSLGLHCNGSPPSCWNVYRTEFWSSRVSIYIYIIISAATAVGLKLGLSSASFMRIQRWETVIDLSKYIKLLVSPLPFWTKHFSSITIWPSEAPHTHTHMGTLVHTNFHHHIFIRSSSQIVSTIKMKFAILSSIALALVTGANANYEECLGECRLLVCSTFASAMMDDPKLLSELTTFLFDIY